jgi:hypothetical protein
MRRYDRRSASSSRSGRWRVLVSVRVWALNWYKKINCIGPEETE